MPSTRARGNVDDAVDNSSPAPDPLGDEAKNGAYGGAVTFPIESSHQVALPLPPTQTTAVRLRDRVALEIAVLKEATEVIVKNHYLHRGRTMAQMPYWITLDGERCGVLLYAYPRMSVKYQGYGPMNLVELARMWIEPRVQGHRVIDSQGKEHAFAVATAAVGQSLRRIRRDWQAKYPHLPDIAAVVSWADQLHHEGTIYRAANFREVGTSGGTLHGQAHRPNGGRDQLNEDYRHLKTAFIFEFRRPERRLVSVGGDVGSVGD